MTSAKAAEASYIQYTGRMQEFVHLFKLVAYLVRVLHLNAETL